MLGAGCAVDVAAVSLLGGVVVPMPMASCKGAEGSEELGLTDLPECARWDEQQRIR